MSNHRSFRTFLAIFAILSTQHECMADGPQMRIISPLREYNSQEAFEFPLAEVGQPTDMVFHIWSTGHQDLVINSITLSDTENSHFTITKLPPSVIPPGTYEEVRVRLLADEPGFYSTLIYIGNGITNSTATRTLLGTVINPEEPPELPDLELALAGPINIIDIGDQSYKTITIRATNIGSKPILGGVCIIKSAGTFYIGSPLYLIVDSFLYNYAARHYAWDVTLGTTRDNSYFFTDLVHYERSLYLTRVYNIAPHEYQLTNSNDVALLDVNLADQIRTPAPKFRQKLVREQTSDSLSGFQASTKATFHIPGGQWFEPYQDSPLHLQLKAGSLCAEAPLIDQRGKVMVFSSEIEDPDYHTGVLRYKRTKRGIRFRYNGNGLATNPIDLDTTSPTTTLEFNATLSLAINPDRHKAISQIDEDLKVRTKWQKNTSNRQVLQIRSTNAN